MNKKRIKKSEGSKTHDTSGITPEMIGQLILVDADGSVSIVPDDVNIFKDEEFIRTHRSKQTEATRGGFVGKEISW
ncbi:hypothetical protein [Companilactobacillus ginsenosidimutans]|uniref:Uncharacterized protein n=1 Tax=Companilactobacillus ginsenosidimutans TaxID=1007676 RepID=A0A0H4QJI4_9LACO|nr:hypothetical protein [Companilactobacillus ginsenosidimutans]AKP67201.1 hypothetical protein ABM34_06400 [Companilactobacillus ginsenosidimutans]